MPTLFLVCVGESGNEAIQQDITVSLVPRSLPLSSFDCLQLRKLDSGKDLGMRLLGHVMGVSES